MRDTQRFLESLDAELGREFILIGSWAIRLHGFARETADVDAMVSQRVLGMLRDRFQIHHCPRAGKWAFLAPSGMDVDLYPDGMHKLPVSFQEVQRRAVQIGGVWVASRRDLATMKRAAAEARTGTKGAADRADLAVLHKPTAWRKARIAARLWLRSQKRALPPRWQALANKLLADPACTDRLIDQAISSLLAKLGEVDEIPFRAYPELAHLCWNRHVGTIAPEDAYNLYVNQWAFVDKCGLEPRERALIQSLNSRFGNMLRI